MNGYFSVKRLATLTLVAALLALHPAAAGAAQTLLRSPNALDVNVALAGDRVLVTSWGGGVRVLSVAPTARPVVLARSGPENPAIGRQFLYAAGSPSSVLVRGGGYHWELLIGPPRGPLHTVERCGSSAALQAIDADLSAWTCGFYLELRLGPYRTLLYHETTGNVTALDVAGRLVAWTSYPDVDGSSVRLTVYDTATGGELYHVDGVPSPHGDLALEPDGTVVIMSDDQGASVAGCSPDTRYAMRTTYFTPGEPFAHDSPIMGCQSTVRVASDRMAFVRPGGRDGVLALADLRDGSKVVDVARLDHAGHLDFDFDGRHVAWARSRCLDDVAEWRDAADASSPEPAQPCPIRLGRPRVDRHGEMRLPVSCPRGCSAVRAGDSDGITITAPTWLTGRLAVFRVPRGGRQLVDLRLSRHDRIRLRHVRPRAVSFSINARNVAIQRTLRPTYVS